MHTHTSDTTIYIVRTCGKAIIGMALRQISATVYYNEHNEPLMSCTCIHIICINAILAVIIIYMHSSFVNFVNSSKDNSETVNINKKKLKLHICKTELEE